MKTIFNLKNVTKKLSVFLFVWSLGFGISNLLITAPINGNEISFLSHSDQNKHKNSTEKKALKLEGEFWQAVQKKEIKKLAQLITVNFQGMTSSGMMTRDEFLSKLTKIKFSRFTFNKFVATKKKDELVITYDLTLIGDRSGGHHLSIYRFAHDEWKMYSHSFLPFK